MEQAGGDLIVDGEEAEVVADGGDLAEFGVNGGLFAQVHCEEIAVAETEAFAFGIGQVERDLDFVAQKGGASVSGAHGAGGILNFGLDLIAGETFPLRQLGHFRLG